jgi:hypothetical protein
MIARESLDGRFVLLVRSPIGLVREGRSFARFAIADDFTNEGAERGMYSYGATDAGAARVDFAGQFVADFAGGVRELDRSSGASVRTVDRASVGQDDTHAQDSSAPLLSE